MIYYEHHLGDYAEATSHLSFVEDAAYSRCIRKYYTAEKPLPTELVTVQRLVGARSKQERAAVEAVLREFFILEPDGWHNARCDEEIGRYKDKQSKAQRSANARWKAKRSDNGGSTNGMRSHSEGNALQSPIPNPQSPITRDPGEDPPTPQGGAQSVFEHWKAVWQHPQARFDPKRRKRIEARLQDFTAEQLCEAISGFRNSPWHCGTDPHGDGKVYDGIDTLLRDTAQVEEGIRLFAHPPHPPPKPETATERLMRLNSETDESRVIEHDPTEPFAITRQ